MRDHVAAQDAARDLGAAGVVDDRDPAAANVLEEPAEWFGVPWLAGAAEYAQAREVMSRWQLVAVGHEPAHEGGGDAEHRDLVVRHHAPQAIRRRMIRRALVQDHGRAERE